MSDANKPAPIVPKTVALVAHDNRKKDLAEWVAYNYGTLADHHIVCTGTTGKLIEETLARRALEEGGAFSHLRHLVVEDQRGRARNAPDLLHGEARQMRGAFFLPVALAPRLRAV